MGVVDSAIWLVHLVHGGILLTKLFSFPVFLFPLTLIKNEKRQQFRTTELIEVLTAIAFVGPLIVDWFGVAR